MFMLPGRDGGETVTDEDAKAINNIVAHCKYRRIESVCHLCVLPCGRVIDKGKCPQILEYLKKNKEKLI